MKPKFPDEIWRGADKELDCCGVTDKMRDLLTKCKEEGLSDSEILTLQTLLNKHEPVKKQYFLDKIFRKLGVAWNAP